METIKLTDAKARLNQLVDRVEAGETIGITRRGKSVALLTAAVRSRKPIDMAMLKALTTSMPRRRMMPPTWYGRYGTAIAIDALWRREDRNLRFFPSPVAKQWERCPKGG